MNTIKWFRNMLTAAYVFIVLLIYPLYMKNGFAHLATAKQTFYYIFSCCLLLPAFILQLIILGSQRHAFDKSSIKKMLLSPDGFILGYFIVLIISTCSSAFKSDALFGASTWYMGFFSQGLYCLSYFLISRSFTLSEKWFGGLFISSGIVCLLCVLNRFHLDPLGIYSGRDEAFWNNYVSTLGQKNWTASFIAIVLAVECGVFLVYGDQKSTDGKHPYNGFLVMFSDFPYEILMIISLVIGFTGMVMQDSDSIYVSILFVLLFLFEAYCHTWKQLHRFFELLMIGLGSLLLLGAALYIFKDHLVPISSMPTKLCQSSLILLLFVLVVIIWFLLGFWLKKGSKEQLKSTEKWLKFFKWFIGILAFVVIIGLIVLIYLVTNYRDQYDFGSLADSKYFYFDGDWGTYRGKNWIYSIKVMSEYNIWQHLFGIGPDCYSAYTQLYHPEFADQWKSAIANSHNEFLTQLINVGILGAICYYGIFLTNIKNALKGRKTNPYIIALAAGVVGSNFNNLFSFMNCIATPLLFTILGLIRGYSIKKEDDLQPAATNSKKTSRR